MALNLIFADSLAHYNDTALKWSSGGGVFGVNPVNLWHGLPSLRIQSGNAPSIRNFRLPADPDFTHAQAYSAFTVGFAWQTSSLAGETIFELWNYLNGGPDLILYLVQNVNGSISVFSGLGPTLIGTTAAGVLTTGRFYGIELAVDLFGATLILTVTTDAGVASVVLNGAGFATIDGTVDALLWGGPVGANHAWITSFYFAFWDTDPTSATLGAPAIYGLSVPIADGLGMVTGMPDPAPFNGSAAPFFPQVDTIPQSTATFISRAALVGLPNMFQGFRVTAPAIPPASLIAAVQVTMLTAFTEDLPIGSSPVYSSVVGFTGGGVGDFGGSSSSDLLIEQVSPFLCYEFPMDTNPLTGVPFHLAEFSGPTALQFGPKLTLPG